MILLFRRLRRRLLGSENARKYALYATGEVVLVVVGILIALQLNAWREARKDRAFELTMLREIETVLRHDVDLIHMLYDRLAISEDGSQRVLQLLLRGDAPADSLDFPIRQSRTWISLSINRGPYDALKATGLDRVSNDDLRSMLIAVYDFRLPRTSHFLDLVTADFNSMLPLHSALYERVPEIGPDNVHRVGLRFTANDDLVRATVPELVSVRMSAVQSARSRLDPLRADSERLLELLAAELGGASESPPGLPTPPREPLDR